MAEVSCDHDSNSEDEVMALCLLNPPPKRRRILNPLATTAVPIYPNKVTRSRKQKPAVSKQVDCTVNKEEVWLWSSSLPKSNNKPFSIIRTDSEEKLRPQLLNRAPSSPPPPGTPPVLKSNRKSKKIRKLNQKLDALSSRLCLTPERHEDILDVSDFPPQINDCYYDDDIIIISSENKQKRCSSKPRKRAHEISLKFRWQLDVHTISVHSTDPLSKAIAQLSVKLKVSPSKILLMRNGDELPVHATITQLDLGIADVIDYVVLTDDKEDKSSCDVITVRLQGKEKGSTQEYSLHTNSPLGSVMSQYTSGLSAAARRKVKFLFDGLKVAHHRTPSQLDMDDGDVIDVWT